jgi:allantoinase
VTATVIRGGMLVDELSARQADLMIEGGRVQGVRAWGEVRAGESVVEATGLHILPGLVDAHVHFNEPGRTDWEGFLSGTTAAAAGGITTVCDMPLNSDPPTVDGAALDLKRQAVAPHAIVDYAFWGGAIPGSLENLSELARGGVVGVKAFLCDSGLAGFPPLDSEGVREAMRRCAELRLLLALHAEDPAETHRLADEARAAGRRSARDWASSRPPSTELDAVEGALAIAREVDVRVHFVHISTAAAARRIAQARHGGEDVSVETCPHYLLLDTDDLDRLGSFAKCAPPLRDRPEVERLWEALLDGAFDWVASDHSPCPPTLKETEDIWSAWGGLAGVQTLLPALLTEGVHTRELSLSRLVTLTSGVPSRRLGLYPRKGALDPGSDADFVLVDLDREWILRRGDLRTRWPVNPFVGRTFRGSVVATFVRGQEVWRDGTARVPPGFGRSARG